jgi:hypothetical protein
MLITNKNMNWFYDHWPFLKFFYGENRSNDSQSVQAGWMAKVQFSAGARKFFSTPQAQSLLSNGYWGGLFPEGKAARA